MGPDQIGLDPQDSLANGKGDFDGNPHQHCELGEVLFKTNNNNTSVVTGGSFSITLTPAL